MPGESQWMKRLKPFLKREIPVAVVILLGLISVGFFFDRGNHATIDLEAISDQKVNCQIRLNWGKASNPRPLTIYPGITNYRFTVRKFSRHYKFTIYLDADQPAATFRFRKVVIHQPGSPRVQLVGQKLLMAMSNSESVTLRPADDGDVIVDFVPKETARDVPELNFSSPIPLSKAAWWAWVISGASILCVVMLIGLGLCVRLIGSQNPATRTTPQAFVILAAIASALILCLSLSSAFNSHPDEIWHIASVSYFLFDPYPAIKNTLQSIHAFSAYQSSYLSTGDLYYPVAAVWTSLISTLTDLPLDHVQMIRLLSVTCFVLLVCLLIRQKNHGLLIPFLITPQVWYVFGYANSDWFGVAAATALLLFLNFSQFTFHRFVVGGSYARFLQLVPLFILVGILIFSKPNYWVVAIFCFYEPLVRILRKKSTVISRIRALAFCLIILVVSSLCIAMKSSFARATETHLVQTSEARPGLSLDKNLDPLTRMSKTRNLYLHHVSLWNLLTERQWIWLSCRSFFGDFGWMGFHLTTSYYCIVILLFGALLFAVVRTTRVEENFWFTAWFTVLVIGANISSSIAFSWIFDLQPQGRYLFPSLLAIGWMLSRLRNWQSSRIVFGFVLVLAILGIYAFTCYALIPLKEHVPSSFL
jgi:Predicted membrane protein (DUF2142)